MTNDEKFFRVLKKDVIAFGGVEAIIIALISEFESRNLKCWGGRSYIAKRVGLSEATTQRKIDTLIKLGALRKTRDGGPRSRRYLETVEGRWDGFAFVEEQSVFLSENPVYQT